MSKLRADITWNHCVNSNSSITTPFNIITDVKDQINDPNENPDKNPNENPENEEEEEDNNDDDSTNLEKAFGNYLQGWAEMLEEETLTFQNDEIDEIEELNEITVNNVIHSAIDPNAKWNLDSLFKKLELPF